MSTTQADTLEAYRKAQAEHLAADEAFEAELQRVYGPKRSSDARYFPAYTDEELSAAKARKVAASVAQSDAAEARRKVNA